MKDFVWNQALFWIQMGAIGLLAGALIKKFSRVRGYDYLIVAIGATIVLKIASAWAMFFSVMKPHLMGAAETEMQSRIDQSANIFIMLAFAWAIYHLGGKPEEGFWNWIRSDDENEGEQASA